MTVARARLQRSQDPLARVRVRFSEIEGWRRYLAPLAKRANVLPDILPTAQVSGRWSTTRPPITNFPPELRDGTAALPGKYLAEPWCSGIFLPDEGYYWLKWDWNAIEARLEAIISGDEEELRGYANRWDVHVLLACTLFDMPRPPVLTKAVHTAPEAAEWRDQVRWEGEEDKRRHVAKIIRYNLVYARDERGILESLDRLAEFGVDREGAITFAKTYLASRPIMVAAKDRVGGQAAKMGLARTAFGRPRQLFGNENARRKEGWSHVISGTVSDLGNMCAVRIQQAFPDATIVMNIHDSQTWQLQEPLKDTLAVFKDIVSAPVTVWGTEYSFPASWYAYTDDGKRRAI